MFAMRVRHGLTVPPWGAQLECRRFFIAFPVMVGYTYCMLDRARHADEPESALHANERASCDEWADYVPEGIDISESRRRELREEHERYLDELIREVGEPTAEEMARAEAWWRPIEEHLTKDIDS